MHAEKIPHHHGSGRSSLEKRLKIQLDRRINISSNRSLDLPKENNCVDKAEGGIVDFSSNDYLGLAHSLAQHQFVQSKYNAYTASHQPPYLGSTGSRLLSGNSKLALHLEKFLAQVHNRPSALIFNSGYDANLSILSSLPLPRDFIILDELCHNSIIMGVKMSRIPMDRVHYFKHNDMQDLKRILSAVKHMISLPISDPSSDSSSLNQNIMVGVESVYSMDGDVAPLRDILDLALQFGACVLVDEAHGLGVYGRTNAHNLVSPTVPYLDGSPLHDKDGSLSSTSETNLKITSNSNSYGGSGVLAALELEHHPALLAGVFTFGKAAGCHGAVITGSQILIDYLVNYARPFIYSTSLPSHSLWAIKCSYDTMTSKQGDEMRAKVFGLVSLFRDEMMEALRLGGRNEHFLLPSPSPIQAVICPGNEHCIAVSKKLRALGGIGVFPIRSPTVPKGEERIRIIVHAHNTKQEVLNLVECLIHFTGEVNDVVVNEDNRQERLLSKL